MGELCLLAEATKHDGMRQQAGACHLSKTKSSEFGLAWQGGSEQHLDQMNLAEFMAMTKVPRLVASSKLFLRERVLSRPLV